MKLWVRSIEHRSFHPGAKIFFLKRESDNTCCFKLHFCHKVVPRLKLFNKERERDIWFDADNLQLCSLLGAFCFCTDLKYFYFFCTLKRFLESQEPWVNKAKNKGGYHPYAVCVGALWPIERSSRNL